MSDLPSRPEPFFGRDSLIGFPGRKLKNYFVIMLVVFFLLPFISRGARRAIESNNNDVRDWLPPNYIESTELKWFQEHFVGEQFALVSWDDCTLGNTQKLDLLVQKLVPDHPKSDRTEAHKLYKSVLTGPQAIEQLTSEPLSLSYDEAVKRLEGALVGPDLDGKGHAGRTTCLVVTLSKEGSKNNKRKREALEGIREAARQCAIPIEGAERIRMGGPPVDNVTIDIEGERTLIRLAVLSGLVGVLLSYLCFRSFKLTGMVFAVGVLSAGISLAIVFYYSVFEMSVLDYDRPYFGSVDAILMSMPAVVYVLGLSGAIHIINYYRDARREQGLRGAVETALSHGWAPCTLAALTTAVGLASLFTSDIMPIRKFGTFSAVGVLTTLTLLFSYLPAALHRFPPSDDRRKKKSDGSVEHSNHPRFNAALHAVARFIIGRHAIVATLGMLVLVFFAVGMTRIETQVQLLKLFDANAPIIDDYAWLEHHLGNLVPMEVIVRVDAEHLRKTNEDAEADGQRYRMNMFERMELAERIHRQVETLPQVDRAMSVATFGPNLNIRRSGVTRLVDPRNVLSRQMEKHRGELLAGDYLRNERFLMTDAHEKHLTTSTGAELLRVSARLPALDDIDYGQFVKNIEKAVEPVLDGYAQRDMIVAALHADQRRLRMSKVCLIYESSPEADSTGTLADLRLLRDLLRGAGAKVTAFNAQSLAEANPDQLEGVKKALASMDCIATLPDFETPDVLPDGPTAIHLDHLEIIPHTVTPGVGAAYTGVVPLVYKTQRQLLISLRESMAWACGLIVIVMIVVFRSLPAGMLTMIPNVFPIVLVFGALGWLGIKVDIGIMMCASVALGVAVDDTVHFLTWFRTGIQQGMNNKQATMLAYERCGTAMLQTTVIGGLGLSVFAASTFTPTQQFGLLMVTLLAAALLGDLIVLPAILSGWFGKFFCGGIRKLAPVETQVEDADAPAAEASHSSPAVTKHGKVRKDLPHSPLRT